MSIPAFPADAAPCWLQVSDVRSQSEAHQLVDPQRDDAKHLVAEHLGVARTRRCRPPNSSLSRPLTRPTVERSRQRHACGVSWPMLRRARASRFSSAFLCASPRRLGSMVATCAHRWLQSRISAAG